MKNSTILVAGTLVLAGVGAYFYLKGKKATTTSVLDTATGTTKTTNTDLTSGTAVTTATNIIEEPKTNNYILAKNIAGEIKALVDKLNNLPKNFFGSGISDRRNLESQLQQKQSQLKTLSYKMTANFEVEKI
jgi:hypothetical protein